MALDLVDTWQCSVRWRLWRCMYWCGWNGQLEEKVKLLSLSLLLLSSSSSSIVWCWLDRVLLGNIPGFGARQLIHEVIAPSSFKRPLARPRNKFHKFVLKKMFAYFPGFSCVKIWSLHASVKRIGTHLATASTCLSSFSTGSDFVICNHQFLRSLRFCRRRSITMLNWITCSLRMPPFFSHCLGSEHPRPQLWLQEVSISFVPTHPCVTHLSWLTLAF